MIYLSSFFDFLISFLRCFSVSSPCLSSLIFSLVIIWFFVLGIPFSLSLDFLGFCYYVATIGWRKWKKQDANVLDQVVTTWLSFIGPFFSEWFFCYFFLSSFSNWLYTHTHTYTHTHDTNRNRIQTLKGKKIYQRKESVALSHPATTKKIGNFLDYFFLITYVLFSNENFCFCAYWWCRVRKITPSSLRKEQKKQQKKAKKKTRRKTINWFHNVKECQKMSCVPFTWSFIFLSTNLPILLLQSSSSSPYPLYYYYYFILDSPPLSFLSFFFFWKQFFECVLHWQCDVGVTYGTVLLLFHSVEFSMWLFKWLQRCWMNLSLSK